MSGFDFSVITPFLEKVMDTDQMDIARSMEIENPDGSTGQTRPDVPIYSGVPCHVAPVNIDNPDPTTVDTRPIIVTLLISCSIYVDLQNNDTITARVLDKDGVTLITYKGIIGAPSVMQSRQEIQMIARADV